MAPVDALQRLVVGALQPQFQPHLVTPGLITGQQVQHRIRHAIWARPHTQAHHVAHRQRLFIHALQVLHFGIGAGIGLKIGEIALGAGHFVPTGQQLLHHGELLGRFVGKGGDIAEGAATTPQGAITIGAGEGAVNGELVDLLAMALLEILAECIDEFV